jgi:hypothetical protein
MATLIALVLLMWGVTVAPAITVEFSVGDMGVGGQANVYAPGKCMIGLDGPRWERLNETERMSLMLHEVGHCLGLGHYGSCNANLSIMGCPSLGRVTDYDRAMLAGNRLFVPMVVY